MNISLSQRLAKELSLDSKHIEKTIGLIDEGATIPFMARYRKEVTGGLDEIALTNLRDGLERLRTLDKRREAILAAMTEREQLTPELASAIEKATSLSVLEDIYLPYKPKRVTRAAKARERGLEPLADIILEQNERHIDRVAKSFIQDGEQIDAVKAVPDIAAALAGARDIIAERIAEDMTSRTTLRTLFVRRASVSSKVVTGKEEEGATYQDYFGRQEQAATMPAHRLLAVLRGEREGFLSLKIRPDDDMAAGLLARQWLKHGPQEGSSSGQVDLALRDAWQRLMAPSLENEYRSALTERAEHEAIAVFTSNLRKLLLAPPLGPKRTLALDPGWRTGAKLVCLDEYGTLLHHDVIYPLTGGERAQKAEITMKSLCQRHNIEAIAIGNGTAGRETEAFVKGLQLTNANGPIHIYLTDERGASVYSASEVARAEFPDYDVTVRGAVSIGRRLMDPLAELVKIDPAALGVGQYQHDVDQGALQKALAEVVASCVNAVGVDMNTASPQLLSHVSGIGPALAKNIVVWRTENGPFTTRRDLLKVPRLGPKAFELAAGFLRIPHGKEPLDASAVHPERYKLVQRMAQDVSTKSSLCTVKDLLSKPELRARINLADYVDDTIGMPTLNDIMTELAKPGRDPRPTFEHFSFTEGVTSIEHVEIGMELSGIVTNVTQFGAFVDIGVHRDGLVHISQLADRFISKPADVVSTGMKVRVRVLDVDLKRGRINLVMKGVAQKV